VIIIDELADIMASHSKEVEAAIVRLAQMSAGVGIHLIVSTQRHIGQVLTGLIKLTSERALRSRCTQIDREQFWIWAERKSCSETETCFIKLRVPSLSASKDICF